MDCEPTAVEEEATCGFHSLPDDVVATVLCCLEAHDVASSQAACQRVRDVVVRHEIWKRLCLLKAPSLSLISQLSVEGCAFPAVSHLRTAGTEYQRSFLYQALWHRLSATPAQESLIADVLSVSSVDNPEEGGQNVLRPEPRNTRNWAVCYWSSKGSDDEESAETMTLQLAHPLCLVNEIRIRPFKAYFQPGQPIYAAKAVRFSFGCVDCFASGSAPEAIASTIPAPTRGAADMGNSAASTPSSADAQHAPATLAAAQHAPAPAAPALPPHAGPERSLLPADAAAMRDALPWQPGLEGSHPGIPRAHALPEGALLPAESDMMQARLQAGAGREWLWTSDAFPMEHSDHLQSFPIPATLCVGGHLKIEFLGRVQKQDVDDRWYTCMCYIRAAGTPLYNFTVTPGLSQPAASSSATATRGLMNGTMQSPAANGDQLSGPQSSQAAAAAGPSSNQSQHAAAAVDTHAAAPLGSAPGSHSQAAAHRTSPPSGASAAVTPTQGSSSGPDSVQTSDRAQAASCRDTLGGALAPSGPSWALRMVQRDALVAAGGLQAVSERGRLQTDMPSDSDLDMPWGEVLDYPTESDSDTDSDSD